MSTEEQEATQDVKVIKADRFHHSRILRDHFPKVWVKQDGCVRLVER